jgi:hypothetical protein
MKKSYIIVLLLFLLAIMYFNSTNSDKILCEEEVEQCIQ